MSSIPDVLTAMRQRRSVRKFTDQPVTTEALTAMLEAGRWAPSGRNNQPWRFLVVRAGDPRQQAVARCTKYAPIVLAAQALVVVVLDKAVMYSPVKDHQGAGACIQNMLLAAHGQGLGAVWLGEPLNQEAEVLAALGLEAVAYELMAVLAVGHPAHPGAATRKPLSELLLEPL